MEDWIWPVAIAVVVLALVVWAVSRAMKKRRLQQQFGPEYERSSEQHGGRGAVRELSQRQKRREELDIRPLSPSAWERYRQQWRDTQVRFVDQPELAVREADALVGSVMRERGYPMDDFEQRAADISVDHPQVVENYRAARDISIRSERGEATTEDLRQAMVHFRALLEELLEAKSESNGSNGNTVHIQDDQPSRR